MKFALVLTVAVTAAAFGSSSEAQTARDNDVQAELRKKLANPETAKFGEVIAGPDGKSGCMLFDSKGTHGRYMGWGSALLAKANGKWVVVGVNGNPAECRLKN